MELILNSIVFPALIGVVGFIGKSYYDIYIDNRKRKIQQLEDKLKNFYWPLLLRIEKDNAIWDKILSKKEDENSIQYRIATHIEEEVLNNHKEALTIIENNIHIAELDKELIAEIKNYIRNITIYEAIRKSGDNKTFPIHLGAEWPHNFYPLLERQTNMYQEKLNSMMWKL